MKKRVTHREIIEYMLQTGATRSQAAEHFDISYEMAGIKIREFKKEYPEEAEKYPQIFASSRVKKFIPTEKIEEIIRYKQETGKPIREILTIYKISKYKFSEGLQNLEASNPELCEKYKNGGNGRNGEVKKEDIIKLVTERRMTTQEVAEHFNMPTGIFRHKVAKMASEDPEFFNTFYCSIKRKGRKTEMKQKREYKEER